MKAMNHECKFLQIGSSLTYSYFTVDSSTNQPIGIDSVHKKKDLGVWCTTDHLKPSLHCQKAAAKAMHVLFYYLRLLWNFASKGYTQTWINKEIF